MEKICVVGLGYVGLPLAVVLSDFYEVVGIEISSKKSKQLLSGVDSNNQVSEKKLKDKLNGNLVISDTYVDAADCTVYIVTVPTPIFGNYKPDMTACIETYHAISEILEKDNIVVLESTVYPGASEELLLPILEHRSNLKLNNDFFIGYSPERINPGDTINTVKNISKLISASDTIALRRLEIIYNSVVDRVVPTPSIKVAEASKVMENAQRDVNIAFMNEMERIFDSLNIPIDDVLEAASTKWNFLNFQPGLVGGHCIGIDPYYLMDVSRSKGVEPLLMHSARLVNENAVEYHLSKILKLIQLNLKSDKPILGLGCTFKPNVNDLRNSKVMELYKRISEYGIKLTIHDPLIHDTKLENLKFEPKLPDPQKYSFVIMGVCHNVFLRDEYHDILSVVDYQIGR